MNPALAACRLAIEAGLNRSERLALQAMLEGGYYPPADIPGRAASASKVSRLRRHLAPLGLKISERPTDPSRRARMAPGTLAILAYDLADHDRAYALAADIAYPPADCGPMVEGLSKTTARIHFALVAAGDDFSSQRDLCRLVESKSLTGDAIKVQIHHLKQSVAPHGLIIQCKHGVGWRYQPDLLAKFLGASVAAEPAHLSPIKEGPAR